MANSKILILNGPGLNDQSVEDRCRALCEKLSLELDYRQADKPDQLTLWIAEDSDDFAAIVINPTGFDEYPQISTAIAQLSKPVVEVHLNNIFREGSTLVSPLAGPEDEMGLVCGFGAHSYLLGIRAVAQRIQA